MIKSFKDKEAQKIFDGLPSKKFGGLQKVIKRKLDMLHYAYNEQDLTTPPANRFEHLKGSLKDYCSIRVNDQFRIIFKFVNNGIYDVQIIDYH